MPNRALLLEDFFILYEGGELALRGTERSLSQGGEGVWGGRETERATAQLLRALSLTEPSRHPQFLIFIVH